jgi:hypothetical protein
MNLFYMKKSRHYPHKTYFKNVRTGKSQFGKSTFENRKIPLPTGWVRLNTGDSPYYKYIGNQNDSSLYAPKLDKTIENENATCMQLKLLNTEKARIEILRRNDLFESIANILNMDSSDIRDESVEYLASKNGIISAEKIISHIENEESTVHAETTFRKFQTEDPDSYTSERSLRELVGINSFFNEDDIMSQMENFLCPIGHLIMVDPVIITSGVTYERSHIHQHLFGSRTSKCPITKTVVDLALIIPNLSLRAIIENFYEKHKDQRSGFWTSLREEFDNYAVSASQRPINFELTEEELRYAALRRERPYDFL